MKEEAVDLSAYGDFHDAYQSIGRFVGEVYPRKCIHPALGYLTPAEFEANWRAHPPEPVLK
jgi:transposase InsO family protein